MPSLFPSAYLFSRLLEVMAPGEVITHMIASRGEGFYGHSGDGDPGLRRLIEGGFNGDLATSFVPG